jgi:hypothetical protein
MVKQTLSSMPMATREQQQNMMRILQKFHQQSLLEEEEGDTDEEDPSIRFQNIPSEDVDAIWERLTEKERQEFLQLLEKGDHQLLPPWEPWWCSSSIQQQHSPIIHEMEEVSSDESKSPQKVLPSISDDLISLSQQKLHAIPERLELNLMELLCSFAYLCRWLNGALLEPDMCHLAATTLLKMCRTLTFQEPFTFKDLPSLIDEWNYRQLTRESDGGTSKSLLCRSIEDACILLSSKHYILRALSELRRLCATIMSTSRSHFLAERKLRFYQCWQRDAYNAAKMKALIAQTQSYLAFFASPSSLCSHFPG